MKIIFAQPTPVCGIHSESVRFMCSHFLLSSNFCASEAKNKLGGSKNLDREIYGSRALLHYCWWKIWKKKLPPIVYAIQSTETGECCQTFCNVNAKTVVCGCVLNWLWDRWALRIGRSDKALRLKINYKLTTVSAIQFQFVFTYSPE